MRPGVSPIAPQFLTIRTESVRIEVYSRRHEHRAEAQNSNRAKAQSDRPPLIASAGRPSA